MAALALILVLQTPLPELQENYKQQVARADWDAVDRVAASIGRLGTQEAGDFLVAELSEATRTEHRVSLFRARASMKLPRQTEFLQDYLGAEEPFFRAIALEALAKLNKVAGRKRAIAVLEVDDDPRVRRTAAKLLAGLKGPGTGLAMVKAATSLAPPEQARIISILHGLDAPDLMGVDTLAADPDVRLRALAVLALSGKAAKDFRHILERARKDLDRGVAIAAAAGLDRIKTPGRSSAVRRVLNSVKGFEQRWDLFDLISRMRLRDPSLFKMVELACTAGDKWLRPKAAETLGYLGGDEAVKVLAPLALVKKPWQVALGAARGLGAARVPAAVEPLIACLKRARGRVGHEASKSLERITGQPFGLNWRMWEFWWERHRTGYRVPDEIEVKWTEPKAARDRYHFYGVEIRSEAIVFLIDTSGSMNGERIAKLRRELQTVIRSMPAAARFNLITFDSSVRKWQRTLTQAKPARKKSALKFVNRLVASGLTNLWGALQAGMGDNSVDTLVILSDGEPTTGKIQNMNVIRKTFLEMNRKRMIMLNAILLNHRSRHLKAMALLSGGSYKER